MSKEKDREFNLNQNKVMKMLGEIEKLQKQVRRLKK